MERNKLLRLLGIFLALMLALTILSRASASMTVARVRTASPGNMTIYHKVTAMGKVMENQEQAVYTEPDQRISHILVNEGDSVEAGEVLFQVDTERLKEQLLTGQQELQKLELEIEDIRAARTVATRKKQQAMQRAEEDYDRAVDQGEQAISWALFELEQAQERLNTYYDTEWEEGSEELEEALIDAVNAAQKAYEDAVNARDESLKNAERAMEDAKTEDASDSTLEQRILEKEQKELQQKKLQQLADAQGKVISPVKGVVTGLRITTGGLTTADAAVLLADLTTGCKFVAQIGKDQAEYLGKGDTVTLTNETLHKSVENLEVALVAVDEEDPELLDVIVYLPTDELDIGSGAKMVAERKSGTYETCIPIQGLHEGNGESFVYVVQETETVLGKQLSAMKISVQVEDKNESYAALTSGSISSGQKVIVDSNRSITGGSPIRLDES